MLNSVSKRSVAVIIPLYNPPAQWHESCLEHIISLQTLNPRYRFHFVLVNDGSSGNIFRKIRKNLQMLKVPHTLCNLTENYGKGKALRKGVSTVAQRVDFFICVDWDFPFGVIVIGSILKKLEEGQEVVVVDRGEEYLRNIPLLRSFLTRVWRRFIIRFFRLEVPDSQAGVKGFSRTAVQCFLNSHIDSFLHDLEFLLSCRRNQLTMTSVAGQLRGGIKLSDFSMSTYLREIKMLGRLLWGTMKGDEKTDTQRR